MEDKYIDSILGNKKKELDSTEYFDFRELSYETIENGFVLPLKKAEIHCLLFLVPVG